MSTFTKGCLQSIELNIHNPYLRPMLDKSIHPAAPQYYHYYFDLVETNNLPVELAKNATEVADHIRLTTQEKWNHAYAEGKWTVAQVIRHIIETERIFAYRAMRFSRLDATPLPGFDENAYICLLYTSPSPRDGLLSRMPSSA